MVTKSRRNFRSDKKVFTLPSVEVGSILEYGCKSVQLWQVRAPQWEIQPPYFIRKEH